MLFRSTCQEVSPAQRDVIDGVARWFHLLGRPSIVVSVSADAIEVQRTDQLSDSPPVTIPVVVGFVGADGRPANVSVDGAPPAPEATLLLHGRTQNFSLSGVAPGVAVSVLRGYSAPVDLAVDHDTAALATLLTHDPDPFGRWWASEELMIRSIDAHRSGNLAEVDQLMAALSAGLRSAISTIDDPLLLAQLLEIGRAHV